MFGLWFSKRLYENLPPVWFLAGILLMSLSIFLEQRLGNGKPCFETSLCSGFRRKQRVTGGNIRSPVWPYVATR